MRYFIIISAIIALGLTMLIDKAHAKETLISVSVLSHDAKFIGTSMGGVNITIRDVIKGEILAQGVTKGSTGNTNKIMAETIRRHQKLRSEGSARFDTKLDIKKPTKVEISAYGPLAQPQSARSITQQRIIIPGKNYNDSNAILLHMPGMSVDILAPQAHLKRDFDPQGKLTLRANIMKMCGCPLRDQAPWKANDYEVEALIYKNGSELIATQELQFTGNDSQFTTEISLNQPGSYEIYVTAYDPRTKDSGMDITTVILK